MGRKKLGERKKKFDVMRIGRNNKTRLELIREDIKATRGITRVSYDQIFDELLSRYEISSFHQPMYKVGDKLFTNPAKARGEAIRLSIRNNDTAVVPEIVEVTGYDEF